MCVVRQTQVHMLRPTVGGEANIDSQAAAPCVVRGRHLYTVPAYLW